MAGKVYQTGGISSMIEPALRDTRFEEIRFDLKRPCNDCPFRRSSRFHPGIAANTESLCNAIGFGELLHSCHKTDPFADCIPSERYDLPLQHCAGAVILCLKSSGCDLQKHLIRASAEGKIDLRLMRRIARDDKECFTLSEFIKFQLVGVKAIGAGV
jgi:hypothetical protein